MWQPKDYELQAESIAKAFRAGVAVGGNDLGALIEKTARDNALLPEQIRRLGRAVNTAMFSETYNEKTGNDRRVDFTPIDAEHLIEKLQATAAPLGGGVKTASYPRLPDPRARPIEKTAAQVVDAYLPPAVPVVVQRGTLLKLSREIPIDMGGIDLRWQDELRKVARACDHDAHRHGDFEKNAAAVLGPDCLPELAQIRESLKMGPGPLTHEKVAAAMDFIVGEETDATRAIKRAMDHRAEYGRKKLALDETRRRLAQIESEISHVR